MVSRTVAGSAWRARWVQGFADDRRRHRVCSASGHGSGEAVRRLDCVAAGRRGSGCGARGTGRVTEFTEDTDGVKPARGRARKTRTDPMMASPPCRRAQFTGNLSVPHVFGRPSARSADGHPPGSFRVRVHPCSSAKSVSIRDDDEAQGQWFEGPPAPRQTPGLFLGTGIYRRMETDLPRPPRCKSSPCLPATLRQDPAAEPRRT